MSTHITSSTLLLLHSFKLLCGHLMKRSSSMLSSTMVFSYSMRLTKLYNIQLIQLNFVIMLITCCLDQHGSSMACTPSHTLSLLQWQCYLSSTVVFHDTFNFFHSFSAFCVSKIILIMESIIKLLSDFLIFSVYTYYNSCTELSIFAFIQVTHSAPGSHFFITITRQNILSCFHYRCLKSTANLKMNLVVTQTRT